MIFVLIFYLISKRINFVLTKKNSLVLVVVSLILFSLVNLKRIISTPNISYWPTINNENEIANFLIININGMEIIKSQEMCFYKTAPCTHFDVTNLTVKKSKSYYILSKNNN